MGVYVYKDKKLVNVAGGITDLKDAEGILATNHGGTGNSAGYIRTGQKSGTTVGNYATAEGASNESSGISTHAEGYGTVASGKYSHSENGILTTNYSYPLLKYEEGQFYAEVTRVDGQIYVNGEPIEYITPTTSATGNSAHAEGVGSMAIGESSHAEGGPTDGDWGFISGSTVSAPRTVAKGNGSHAEGYASFAGGEGAHSEGRYTKASSSYSHAEGYQTTASGMSSHAEGYGATASGGDSHAEGFSTVGSGYAAHAEGRGTTASGDYAHAEGRETTASNICAHAEGYQTTASGTYSHAAGTGTLADYANQTVVGKYNENKFNSLFEVGNGTSDSRSNAFEVASTGNITAKGSLTLGSPLTAANGGTGITSSPSMLTNLGSTSAANVFQASPRPGITGTLPIANGGTGATTWQSALINLFNTSSISNAGFHNSIYRGKYLGTSLTSAQSTAITNGTFDDLFIGDYWTISSINWRIAAFDYWYQVGDTVCTTHHVVVVPDTTLYTARMNSTDTTAGGYVASEMYKTNLSSAKTTINNAFGSGHVLSHRILMPSAVADGVATSWAWYTSTVELMTEPQVYGTYAWGKTLGVYGDGTDVRQLPLFALNPQSMIAGTGSNRKWWWLRTVATAAWFSNVSGHGAAGANPASYSGCGVRPLFGIY